MKHLLVIIVIFIYVQSAFSQNGNPLCFLLSGNEIVCNQITKSELKKIKGLTLEKEFQLHFKLIYAEVQILHKSGKLSDVFILKNSQLTDELKNYIQNKTFLGDAIIISSGKVEDINPSKSIKFRDLEKKVFKVVEPIINTTK